MTDWALAQHEPPNVESLVNPHAVPEAPASGTRSGPPEGHRALREVFDSQAVRVHRTLRALGVHPSCVDDALQDVFLVIHDKLPAFVPEAQLSTWIYAITYRVAQNYRRRTQRTNHSPLSGEEVAHGQSPESESATAQAALFVRDFCDSVAEEKRDVFVLCVLEERTAPEVAALLDVKLNTVYSRLRNVRAEFRERLLQIRKKEVR